MPRTAYLDANVYNDIERGVVPASDLDAVRAAKRDRALVIRLGLCDLEEAALAVWDTDYSLALRRLALMRELAGFDSLLKQPSDVLDEAIRSYATGAFRPSPLLPLEQSLYIANRIAEGIGDPAMFAPMVGDIIRGIQDQKETTRQALADGRQRTLKEIKEQFGPRAMRDLAFKDFFEAAALGWAEEFACRPGVVDACRARGLDGLLNVPTVRLAVGTTLSIIHALTTAERLPTGGDAYDIWHAIQASTADVFVTKDDRLLKHMAHIPGVTRVRTARSLHDLLATLGS